MSFKLSDSEKMLKDCLIDSEENRKKSSKKHSTSSSEVKDLPSFRKPKKDYRFSESEAFSTMSAQPFNFNIIKGDQRTSW